MLLIAGAVLGIAVAVFARHSDLSRVKEVFRQADAWWLVVALLPQAGTYYSDAVTYIQTLGIFRIKTRLADATSIVLSMEFLNDITPSFGATSNLYLAAMLKSRGLNAGEVGLTLMIQSMTSFVAFSVAMAAAAGYLLYRGEINALTTIFALIFVWAGGLFWILILLIFARDNLLVKLTAIGEFAARKLLRKRLAQSSLDQFRSEVRSGRKAMGQNKRSFLMLVLIKISRFLFEGMTIYFLFRAFGLEVSYGLALLGFLIAMLLSTFSFLPGGVGSFETLMVLTYKSHGVPLETAGIVTLAYRIITFWLPMPVGIPVFHRTIASKVKIPQERF